jgi:hypothetical protein
MRISILIAALSIIIGTSLSTALPQGGNRPPDPCLDATFQPNSLERRIFDEVRRMGASVDEARRQACLTASIHPRFLSQTGGSNNHWRFTRNEADDGTDPCLDATFERTSLEQRAFDAARRMGMSEEAARESACRLAAANPEISQTGGSIPRNNTAQEPPAPPPPPTISPIGGGTSRSGDIIREGTNENPSTGGRRG